MKRALSWDTAGEFVGQIIDAFEYFLESKGISIENHEKQEAVHDGEDSDSICILYGTDYGELQSYIEGALINWGLLPDHE